MHCNNFNKKSVNWTGVLECTKNEVYRILYIQIVEYSRLKSYSFVPTVELRPLCCIRGECCTIRD